MDEYCYNCKYFRVHSLVKTVGKCEINKEFRNFKGTCNAWNLNQKWEDNYEESIC